MPDTIITKIGDIIKWDNFDVSLHTVTSDDNVSFNSDTILVGNSYKYTASVTGTFEYHCKITPSVKGVLIVNP